MAKEEVQKRKNVLHFIGFFKLTEDTAKTEKIKKTEASFTLRFRLKMSFEAI